MNIVLVSMDGVRPDFLGHDFFSRIRKESLDFKTCIVQAPHTSTSHTSILTGLYPFNHGVRWLVDFNVKAKMIQEILKEKGFHTAAFIGGFPLTEGNLNRGFNVFVHEELIDDIEDGREKFMPADIVVQKTISWLQDKKTRDNFVFLHFFDAHLMLRSEFGKKPWPGKDANGIFICIDKYLGRRKRRYKEEIDFIGNQLERLFDALDIDLLILTADHGTKMQGDKNYPWVYNSKGEKVGTQFHVAELYEQQLKVPLFFWGKMIQPGIITQQVRSIDIMPTVLDVLGITIPDVDGSSLLKKEYPQCAYSETYFAQLVEANRRACELYQKSSWGWVDVDSLVCLRSNKYKLICTADQIITAYELYDLEKDPQENNNLINDQYVKRIREELEGNLFALIKDDSQMHLQSNVLDETVKERLENLGYL